MHAIEHHSQNRFLRRNYAWVITFACCILICTGQGVIGNSIGLFLNPLAEEFGLGMGGVSTLLTIRYAFIALALPTAGRLLQTVNIKVLLGVSYLCFFLGFTLFGRCSSALMVYLCSIIYGITSAFTNFIQVPYVVTNWFEKDYGLALGITASCSGIGTAVASPIINRLILAYGWRRAITTIGLTCVPFALVVIIFIIQRRPSDMGLQPYGHISAAEPVPPAEQNDRSSSAAAVSRDSSTEASARPKACCALFGVFIMIGTLSLYQFSSIIESFGYDSTFAAANLSALSIGLIINKIFFGKLIDRIGMRKSMYTGLVMSIIALGGMSALHSIPAVCGVCSFFIGGTVALNAVFPPYVTNMMYGKKDYGKVYSRITAYSMAAAAVFIALFGYIFDWTGSFVPVLLLQCLSVGLAMVTYFRIEKLVKSRKE